MTPISLPHIELLAVETPEGITNIAYYGSGTYGKHGRPYNGGFGFDLPNGQGWNEIELPPGSYTLIGLLSDITEEQARMILGDCPECGGSGITVEHEWETVCCGYEDEDGSCCGKGKPELKARQAQCAKCEATGEIKHPMPELRSLLTSHGLKGNNIVLLEKTKL